MIRLLTTSIQQQQSGGTIFNQKLVQFINSSGKDVEIVELENLNDFAFVENETYIIDSILIRSELILSRIPQQNTYFLIHLWGSILQSKLTLKKSQLAIERKIAESFHLLFTGDSSLHYAKNKLGISEIRHTMIFPGCDFVSNARHNPQLPTKIVYLANFISGKGHEKLIEVIQLLPHNHPAITIDCYGTILDQYYFENFKQSLERQNIQCIHYRGITNHNEIESLLSRYDMMLHFSDYESFGMGVYEALATQLPVLMTPVGNFSHYANFGYRGILPDFSAEKLSHQLHQLLCFPEEYSQLQLSISNIPFQNWRNSLSPLHTLL